MSVTNKFVYKNAGIDPAKINSGLGGLPKRYNAKYLYVDGSYGSDASSGVSPKYAKATIQAAVTAATPLSTIYVFPKTHTDYTGDPVSYAETVIIPYAKCGLSIIGVGHKTQGGLPQIKKGSGTTALFTVRAPGCLIANLGFNGIETTDGKKSMPGILLDDDNSTKAAFGTTIVNCHFKNCAGSKESTDSAEGGAITWSAAGNAWQVLISGCKFYKNVADIVVLGTSNSVPQDVTIEDCVFSNSAAETDCNIFASGSGFGGGLTINRCIFGKQPALGTTDRFTDITCYGTGATGVMSNCVFGAAGTTTGYGAGKATAKIGTTIEICNCYSDAGLIVREA